MAVLRQNLSTLKSKTGVEMPKKASKGVSTVPETGVETFQQWIRQVLIRVFQHLLRVVLKRFNTS